MESDGGRYLNLRGQLHADNRLVLDPFYLTSERRIFEPSSDRDLRAELEDEDGRLLLKASVSATPFCFMALHPPDLLAVRADIPFPAKTRRIRLFRDDVQIHQIDWPADRIKLSLIWKPEAREKGKQRVSWRAEHPDKKAIRFAVHYSHDGGTTWQQLNGWTTRPNSTVNLDTLPGGRRCRLGVMATDGGGSVFESSRDFAVAVKRCIAVIQAPEDGVKIAAGANLRFLGQGFYLEERSPELDALVWQSDRDGRLGQGRSLETSKLSPGHHKITLKAGRGRRVGLATISVSIARSRHR